MSEIETKDSDSPKRLKESEWVVVCHLWEKGDSTLRELSEQFGISEAALSQGFKRRKVKRGAKAHLALKEIEAKTKEERAKLVEEVFQFKKRFLKYGDFLMSLTINEITETKKAKKTLASIRPELESIYSAVKTYKTIRNDMFHLYDLYNPDAQPDNDLEFNIGVYSEEDLKNIEEAQKLLAEKFESSDEEEDDGEE